jgi:hypothetical protein
MIQARQIKSITFFKLVNFLSFFGVLLSFCYLFLHHNDMHKTHSVCPQNQQKKESKFHFNPPIPRISKKHSQSVYVAYLAFSSESEHFYCSMKNQSIDFFRQYPLIDEVEIYSTRVKSNAVCNISSIFINSFNHQISKNQILLAYHTLNHYIERSNSDWIFLISGFPVFKNELFLQNLILPHLRVDSSTPMAFGNSIETRNFFHIFTIEGGILINRIAVKKMLENVEKWNLLITASFPADESISQMLHIIGIYSNSNNEKKYCRKVFSKFRVFRSKQKINSKMPTSVKGIFFSHKFPLSF